MAASPTNSVYSTSEQAYAAKKAKQNLEKSIMRNAEKQNKRFDWLMNELDRSSKELSDVDKSLDLFHETNRNKKRHQFEEWNNNVHGSIVKNIQKQIDGMDSKDLNKKKNEDYGKFLDVTNRKSAIFLDIIIESEYDPLEPNRRALRAKTGVLKDPTLVSAQKYQEENCMLGNQSQTAVSESKNVLNGGAKKSCGNYKTKDILPVEQWASGKIEGTPYGTFAKIMASQAKAKDANDAASNTHKSSLVFDDYKFPRGAKAVDAEMPRGKRISQTNEGSYLERIYGQERK